MAKREWVTFNLILLSLRLSAGGCGGRAVSMRESVPLDAGSAAAGGVNARGGADSVALGGTSARAGASSIDAGMSASDAGMSASDAGAVIVGPRPSCGSSDPDTSNSCQSLAQLKFENPRFDWNDAGGAEVVITITNDGPSAVPYPCFGLTVDRPTTNLASRLESNVFALTAGQSGPYNFPLQFAGPVPPGTVLHFTVWVDSLNVGCADVGQFAFAVVTT